MAQLVLMPIHGWGIPRMKETTDPEVNDEAVGRLKKIAGQVTGIQRMVSEDRACVEVLHQIGAAQAALIEVGKVLLAGHVDQSLADALKSQDRQERRSKIDDLVDMFARFCRIEGSAAAMSVQGEIR